MKDWVKKYRNGTELGDNASFPFIVLPERKCVEQKLNWPPVMVSSYLATTEIHLVWSGKGRQCVDSTLGNGLVICPLPQRPSIPRSQTQSVQDDKSTGTSLHFQQSAACRHSLGKTMQEAEKVGNETVSNAHRGPSSLKSEPSAQC